jgi:hypothetical protein
MQGSLGIPVEVMLLGMRHALELLLGSLDLHLVGSHGRVDTTGFGLVLESESMVVG